MILNSLWVVRALVRTPEAIKVKAFSPFTFIVPLTLSIILAGAAMPQPVSARIDAPAVAERMDEYILNVMSQDRIPGAAAVLANSRTTVYSRGFGVSSARTNEPVDQNTVFVLASVSKSFTALGVLLLRDAGYIDLDESVAKYLPKFRLADRNLSGRITVRHLLTHTSGIPGALAEPQGYFDGPNAMYRMVADLKDLKLSSLPGEAFEYSNLNYFLLGALVESVTGSPFEEYMTDNVFRPLGLEHTTLYPEEAEAWGRAYGHQPVFGQVRERSMPFYRSAAPAGWVMSNAVDMGRWLQLFLNRGLLDGVQLVKPETIDEMITPQAFFEKEGRKTGYGMGWLIATDSSGIKRIWHGGDTPSFLADMMLLPEYGIGVAAMINSQAGTHGHQIAPSLASIYLDVDLERMTSPWWAHWKAIDSFSFGGLSLCALLFSGLGIFIWRLVLKLRRRRYVFVRPRVKAKWLPAGQVILFNTPVVLFGLVSFSGYLAIESLYGYNMFTAMGKTLPVIPPSTWSAGMAVMGTIALWSITLALVPLLIRRNDPAGRR